MNLETKNWILTNLEQSYLEEGCSFSSYDNDSFIHILPSDFLKQWDWKFGASKFVFIPKDPQIDFVIKIPYTGCDMYSYSEERSSNIEYTDFCYAECDERPWDYCAGEEFRYQIAKQEGFADYFAETSYLGDINGYPIYQQKKCIPLSDYWGNIKYSYEERQRTKKMCHNISIDSYWLTSFAHCYGDSQLIDFVHFLRYMAWDDDLRSENIGYLNNKPVLIDYSGFLED